MSFQDWTMPIDMKSLPLACLLRFDEQASWVELASQRSMCHKNKLDINQVFKPRHDFKKEAAKYN